MKCMSHRARVAKYNDRLRLIRRILIATSFVFEIDQICNSMGK